MRSLASLAFVLVCIAPVTAAELTPVEKGRVLFVPQGKQDDIPERYRLSSRSFDYEMTHKADLPSQGVRVFKLRFPTALESKHESNNTVYAEYFQPEGKGPFPAVIVLDILGGTEQLPRTIATHLARNKVAALFVYMAYYGPRRPAGTRLKLLSTDLPHTMRAVQQTVLDLRLATAWLESRAEVDRGRLGITGVSLGSLMTSLTAEMEPKLSRVGVLLGGGGFVDAFWDHPQASLYRGVYEAFGGTKERVKQLIAPVDPLTCAANLSSRKLLIMAGKRDEILPPSMAEALWKATGQQTLIWFDCTHYGAIIHLTEALDHLTKHFAAP